MRSSSTALILSTALGMATLGCRAEKLSLHGGGRIGQSAKTSDGTAESQVTVDGAKKTCLAGESGSNCSGSDSGLSPTDNAWTTGARSGSGKGAQIRYTTTGSQQFRPSCDGSYEIFLSHEIDVVEESTIETTLSGALNMIYCFARVTVGFQELDTLGNVIGSTTYGTQPTVSPNTNRVPVEFPFASVGVMRVKRGKYRVSGLVNCPKDSVAVAWLGGMRTVTRVTTDPTTPTFTSTRSVQYQARCDGTYEPVVSHEVELSKPSTVDGMFSGAVNLSRGFARTAFSIQKADATGSIFYGTQPTVSPRTTSTAVEFPFASIGAVKLQPGKYVVKGLVNCPTASVVKVWLAGIKSVVTESADPAAPQYKETSGQFNSVCDGNYKVIDSYDTKVDKDAILDMNFSGAVHIWGGFARVTVRVDALNDAGIPTGNAIMGTQPTVAPDPAAVDVEFPAASIGASILKTGNYRISSAVTCPPGSGVMVWLGGQLSRIYPIQ